MTAVNLTVLIDDFNGAEKGFVTSYGFKFGEAEAREIYPLVSPFIGALGAFITGSNTNSNGLFGNLQMQTAEFLNLSTALILAAQTTGGALGSVMAPAKVILGCSTAGLSGKEGKVIGKLTLYSGILILLTGISTYIISGIL